MEQEKQTLTVTEAAAYLGLSESYLNKLRCYGGGPQFIKLGKKRILYILADLGAWVSSHKRNNTSEY